MRWWVEFALNLVEILCPREQEISACIAVCLSTEEQSVMLQAHHETVCKALVSMSRCRSHCESPNNGDTDSLPLIELPNAQQ